VVLRELMESYPRLHAVRFRRNYGKAADCLKASPVRVAIFSSL